MSYSMLSAIFLATIVLATSSTISFTTRDPNVLARFYPNFAQLYRPAILNSTVDSQQPTVRYTFFFTEKEYEAISEKSLTLVNTDIIERTITFHPMPNFQVAGTRYFYRRDRRQNSTVEIELVNPEERLFRYVDEPNRYFYLNSFDNLEYFSQMPLLPYYEVTFLCNSSYPTTQKPLLSYIDRSFQYKSRYLIDLPMSNIGQQVNMTAFTDIHNNGERTVVVKGAELIAGDAYFHTRSFDNLFTSFSSDLSTYKTDVSGTYVYQLTDPSSITIPSHSSKSIQFFRTNVSVDFFAFYSSVFTPTDSFGKLSNAYNLTFFNDYLPNGRLLLREQGRYLSQINLPDVSRNETFTLVFASHMDVSYRRQVKLVQGDETSSSMTYSVEYVFENFQLTRDMRVYFTESFGLFKYAQVKDLMFSNDYNLVFSDGTLRGFISLPQQNPQQTIRFYLVIYKFKPALTYDE